MRDEVSAATGRVAAAMKISQKDQDTIQCLKKEIEDAWRKTDTAMSREQAAQEAMNCMREKLEKYQTETEKYGEKVDDDVGQSMAKHKEGLLRERDRLQAEVDELNRRLALQRTYSDEVEQKLVETEGKVKDLYKLLDETSNESFKEKRLLENTQQLLTDTQTDLTSKNEEVKHFKALSEQEHKTSLQQSMQLAALRTTLDRLNTTHNLLQVKFSKAVADYENMVQLKEKVTNEYNTKVNILKLKEDENNKFRIENGKLIKSKEMLMKKIMLIETVKCTMEQEVLKLKFVTFSELKYWFSNKKKLSFFSETLL